MMKFFQLPRFNFISKTYLAVGIILLIGSLSMPYGYYQFLRMVVFGFSAALSYKNFILEDGNKSFWPWLYLLITILFNPLETIHMDKEIWEFIDIVLGVLFCLLFYKIRILEKINQDNN